MPITKIRLKSKRVSIVIPTLNEERNVGKVIRGVKRQLTATTTR